MIIEFITSHKTGVFILILVLLLGSYIYIQNKNGNPVLPGQKPNVIAQDQDLIQKVGNLIVLPSGNPRIATVSDATKLPNQPFFANAQNGDKVLIYDSDGEAILYRPSINKIISVTSIAAISPTSAPQEVSTPSSTVVPIKLK